MKRETRQFLKSFLLELAVYAVLVVAYFYLVLHFLGGWIKTVYDQDHRFYAALALALMIGQGVGLEIITTKLLGVIRARLG